ncbi:MAG: class I SAM-dependent methyltransferase [Nitrososphaerales archaeon]
MPIYPQELTRWEFTSRFISDNIPTGARVLDIGYGTRYWPEKYDVISLGIKPENAYVRNIQDDGLADDIDERFDFICMFEVLEHLEDPSRALRNVHSLGTSYSMFLGSTPNGRDPYYLLTGSKHKDHEIVLTKPSLQKALVEEGFDVIEIKPHILPLKIPGRTLIKNVDSIFPFWGRHLFWKAKRAE